MLFGFTLGFAQTITDGLIYNKPESVSEGYTLFTPELNNTVYLIDNCGNKINEWNFTELPAETCYLLKNGNLLRAGKDSLEIRAWNNNLIWSYAMNNNGIQQHHDIEPLPNGNILCLTKKVYTREEMTALGRDPAITGEQFRLDQIIELKPEGTHEASIVWEWNFADHFIQDFDANKPNYGVVKDHPELVNLNFDNSEIIDWTHVNAIDYNPILDQVLLTVRHLSELYIIDHSTSTTEAASHSGGNSNKGGDLLWRWGNDQVYDQGEQVIKNYLNPMMQNGLNQVI